MKEYDTHRLFVSAAAILALVNKTKPIDDLDKMLFKVFIRKYLVFYLSVMKQ